MTTQTLSTTAAAPSKTLHLGLWAAQVLLAAAFLMAGLMKLTAPLEQLVANMPWVSGAMGSFVRVIGGLEVLGAVGLVLPSATRIAPRLTVFAALGLGLTMLGALATHGSRGEYVMMAPNVVLGGLAAFVAWGRASRAVIAARGA